MNKTIEDRIDKFLALSHKLEAQGLGSQGCHRFDFSKCYFSNSEGKIVCFIDSTDKDNPRIVYC